MLSALLKHWNNLIVGRPPLIIFLICLTTLAVACLSFAYYVGKGDLIDDTDLKLDWTHLLKHFNELQYCVEPKVVEQHNVIFILKTVPVTVEIDVDSLRNITGVEGELSWEGWHSMCPKKGKPSAFGLSFKVPKNEKGRRKVCALLSGPADFIPSFAHPACKYDEEPKVKARLSSTNKKSYEAGFCRSGVETSLNFDPFENLDNFNVHISQIDQEIIFSRLMLCFYFLIGSILVTVIAHFAYFFHREVN